MAINTETENQQVLGLVQKLNSDKSIKEGIDNESTEDSTQCDLEPLNATTTEAGSAGQGDLEALNEAIIAKLIQSDLAALDGEGEDDGEVEHEDKSHAEEAAIEHDDEGTQDTTNCTSDESDRSEENIQEDIDYASRPDIDGVTQRSDRGVHFDSNSNPDSDDDDREYPILHYNITWKDIRDLYPPEADEVIGVILGDDDKLIVGTDANPKGWNTYMRSEQMNMKAPSLDAYNTHLGRAEQGSYLELVEEKMNATDAYLGANLELGRHY